MGQRSLQVLADREWILTNGLGGYALGFGNMINKRKYNGLLISSVGQLERRHLLSTLEEKIESEGNFFFIDSNHYSNCIHPSGYTHLVNAWITPYPCAIYSSIPSNGDYRLFKEIFMCEGHNAVVIKYSNFGNKQLDMVLRPKFTLRNHHIVNQPGTWDHVQVSREIDGLSFKVVRQDNGFEAYGYIQRGEIWDDHTVFGGVFYPVEANRGYDATEDLIAPVKMTASIAPKDHLYLVFSADPIEDPMALAKKAEAEIKTLPLPSDHPERAPQKTRDDGSGMDHRAIFTKLEYMKLLERAARDFITSNDDIVAGYPWFGAWGRDTLISMGGLKCLPNGNQRAVRMLKKYGSQIKSGLLPNTFGEGGKGLNYDSIDAPLWYIIRCYEYAPANKDIFNHVSNIVLHLLNDDSHPFFVAEDGLIEIRHGNHALTWMDAKVYEVPVTPRWGKPIEINALWYNALKATAEIAHTLKLTELRCGELHISLQELERKIGKVLESMKKFVGPKFLADRIEDKDPIWEIRPNAIIALSLPFDFCDKAFIKQCLKVAEDELLTPYGLRSLSPAHPAFKQKYIGNQKQRDYSYHQGTVWSFLMLPFVKVAWKVLSTEQKHDDMVNRITRYIWKIRDEFMKGDAASIAEVWDAIDAYFPKGCPAQAWSVFAMLEIENMLSDNTRSCK